MTDTALEAAGYITVWHGGEGLTSVDREPLYDRPPTPPTLQERNSAEQAYVWWTATQPRCGCGCGEVVEPPTGSAFKLYRTGHQHKAAMRRWRERVRVKRIEQRMRILGKVA